MKEKYVVIFGGLLALLPLASPPAVASDDKTYLGVICSGLRPSDQPHIEAGSNTDPNGPNYVSCPIVRDTTVASVLQAVRIYVRDYSPDGSLICTLFSKNIVGDNIATVTRRVSESGAASGTPNLYVLDLFNTPAADYGFYHFYCQVPARNAGSHSGVVGYRVIEE